MRNLQLEGSVSCALGDIWATAGKFEMAFANFFCDSYACERGLYFGISREPAGVKLCNGSKNLSNYDLGLLENCNGNAEQIFLKVTKSVEPSHGDMNG